MNDANSPLAPCDVRPRKHFPGNVTGDYDSDHSGAVEYRFNSLGYRSEEYDPNARFNLFVIGESHAFGSGVPFEQTFSYRLKQHLAASLNFSVDEVNLVNLSIGGASFDYCVRTIFRQITGCKVDLLVINIPMFDRIEYFGGETFISYSVSGIDLSKIDKAPEALLGFCEFYNPHMGRLSYVKNMILLQRFLDGLGVECIYSKPRRTDEDLGHASLDSFEGALDRTRIFEHDYFLDRVDLGTDGIHAGPLCHGAFAIALMEFYSQLPQPADVADQRENLRGYVEMLKISGNSWRGYHAAKAAMSAKR